MNFLCSPWLKWILMGAGGLGGFMISRKRTKKGLVKAGAAGAGVGVGYLTWLLLQRFCGAQMMPEYYGEDYLPMGAPGLDPSAPRPSAPSPRVPRPSMGPEVVTTGGEDAQPVISSAGPTVVGQDDPTFAQAPQKPARTMPSAKTRSEGMFGGAYGS